MLDIQSSKTHVLNWIGDYMGRVLIIAEAGVNHNGDLGIALKMVDEAKKFGADIVKFQTSIPELVMSKYAPKAEYQKQGSDDEENQIDMANKIVLKSFDDYRKIKEHCEEVGIEFLSTPFEFTSIAFLEELGTDIWKIPSGEITNYPYLKRLACTRKKVILSTGMSTMDEVRDAINILQEGGTDHITLLHCTTEYPAPINEVNLNAMCEMGKTFNLPVGYSDHTKGIEVSIAAVALGATVIEKHFTLDRNMEGPDHKASLEPSEFAELVKAIRNIEVAMGDGIKVPMASEKNNMIVARKSIVAKCNIKKGEVFSEDNLTTKRPGNGISPMKWDEIIGQAAKRDFGEDELIEV